MTQGVSILSQLGKVDALKGKLVTVTSAGQLEIKADGIFTSRFSGCWRKASKLQRLETIGNALKDAVEADARARYSASGSDVDFDVETALSNVNKIIGQLKSEAQKLSSSKSGSSNVFGADGRLAANGDAAVQAKLAAIDSAASGAISQITRLRRQTVANTAVSWFSSNPKDIQKRALQKSLEKVQYDLSIIPQSHADYSHIKAEERGLIYAIGQLEMAVPTYDQDMRNLLTDLGQSTANINAFMALPDCDTVNAVPNDKETQLANNLGIVNPTASQLKKIADLKMIFQASTLVKAPIDYQARKAMGRIAASRRGVARGNIAHLGHDFNSSLVGRVCTKSNLIKLGSLIPLGLQTGIIQEGLKYAGLAVATAVESTPETSSLWNAAVWTGSAVLATAPHIYDYLKG